MDCGRCWLFANHARRKGKDSGKGASLCGILPRVIEGLAGEAQVGLFEGAGGKTAFETGRRLDGEEFAFVKNGDAIGEEFNFVQRVGGEQKRGAACGNDFGFEKAAKVGGGDGVQAAGRFIEKQDAWLMKQGAQQAETLHGAGRESADLAIESADAVELSGERVEAGVQQATGEMIQAAKKTKVF